MANFVFIACSLDGFIAKTDGNIEWLVNIPNPEGSDYGFLEFMNRVDGVLMGRNTYDIVSQFAEWPYIKPVFVLSHSLKTLPESMKGRAEIVGGDITQILEALKKRGFQDLYIDGGKTIQSFLEQDLIDEMTITTVSTVLGGGIPLFGFLEKGLKFRVVKAEILNNQLVKCHYVRDKKL